MGASLLIVRDCQLGSCHLSADRIQRYSSQFRGGVRLARQDLSLVEFLKRNYCSKSVVIQIPLDAVGNDPINWPKIDSYRDRTSAVPTV